MRRRRFLALAAAGCALSGCLGAETGTRTSPDGGTRTPPGAGTRVPRTTDGTDGDAATTDSPVEFETPAPGECEASDPPQPDSVSGELAADESPRQYPAKPDMTASAVRSFVETYERTYQYNAVLAGRVDGVPDGISRVDTWLRGSTLRAVEDGYLVALFVTLNYGDDGEEPGTNSPAPTGHHPTEATYYVTDRFLARRGVVVDPPRLSNALVLECW